ncbi:MAG: hypothetical protein PVI25_10560 [Gammaproteobacteria bacterium]|jgi:hypothetical protein|nr:MAG: hypothetical protein AMJ59_27445 [Gammaproteobacteria bacterium SG8_31]
MFPYVKRILVSAIVVLFSLTAGPVLAGSDVLFTGGGLIKDGTGADAKRITFSVGLFVDVDGMTDGHLDFHFHNLDDVYALDQSRFTASVFDSVLIETQYRDTVPYTFVRIEASGSLDGVEGWSVLARFSDFGVPVNNKEMLPENADALRIRLFGPGGDAVYDTALDYPRDQAWRTLLDGGNVSVDMRLAPDP